MIYKFEFSPEVVQLIALGLRKLPFEQSASMLDMLQKDCAAQEAKETAAQQKASAADSVVAEAKERKKPGRKPKEANGAAEQQSAA